MVKEYSMIDRLKSEIQNAFEDLENKDLDALYGTLLEINLNILPYLKENN